MQLKPTTLVYSSHSRSEYIHRQWIVERALRSHSNKTIFFLPFSNDRYHQQVFAYDNFAWYFSQFEKWGLRHSTFNWNDNLRREDADAFFDRLWHDEVVILGGGNTALGMSRYRAIGDWFYDDPGRFERVLHARQDRGLLNVGFSAGADQLCELTVDAIWNDPGQHAGYGCARNVMVLLHHENGRGHLIRQAATRYHHCFAFGLPNDSGLAVAQGWTPQGNQWQVIHVIIDKSWDIPHEEWHIKTRQGVKVEHYYCDGRHWAFGGGDSVVRINSPDGHYQEAWLVPANGSIVDYWTQETTGYSSTEEILASH